MSVTDKHGCKPDEAVAIVSHIIESCKQLEFVGLMTIGALDYEPSDTEINPDFQVFIFTCFCCILKFVASCVNVT